MIFSKVKIRRSIKKLIIIICLCAVLYFVLILLDQIILPTNNNKTTNEERRTEIYNTPVFGEDKINKEQVNVIVKTIDDYYNYCNNKEYEKAYNLITNECKNKFFPTLEDFIKDVNVKFDKLKLYEYSNVINEDDMYVYELTLYDDVMTYGPTSDNEKVIYYIIINKINDEYKISLNSYIKTDLANYKFNQNNVQVEILSRDIYVDHINVNVKITNNTENTFVYLNNRVKYIFGNSVNRNEFTYINNNLEETFGYVNKNSTVVKELKFNKSFYNDYNHYMFTMGECYFINFITAKNKLTEKMNLNYLTENCISKFDIQIGL